MNRNDQQKRNRTAEQTQGQGLALQNSASPKLTKRRKWLFRSLALLFPILILALAEIGFSLFGYGHATSFLIRKEIQGKPMLVENAWFGLRFFPPALVRSPSPTVLSAAKPPGVYRIFLFGESAVLGDPQPAYGVGRYLETLLRIRFHGTEFEVIPAAMTAINSHGVFEIAKEFTHYQGDQWIVYMGNNEHIGPFGANTIFGPQAPSFRLVRAYLAFQKLRLGQWLASMVRQFPKDKSETAGWSGLRMFLDHPLSPMDPRREKVNSNFRHNLADLVRLGQRSGVPVLLCTVASNLKDCAPFSSAHAPDLEGSIQAEWTSLRQLGASQVEQKRWQEAVSSYQKAIQLSTNYAEVYFQLGQCYLALSNFALAQSNFALARDLDALPFRADSRLNTIIREVAKESAEQRVAFLDTEELLGQKSPNGITGRELFYEHVHLNFEGNYQLALAMAEKVLLNLPAEITRRQSNAWATVEQCNRNVGLTDLNRSLVLSLIIGRLSDLPYTGQLNHIELLRHWNEELAKLKQNFRNESRLDGLSLFEEARKAHPQNHWLRRNEAEFLEGIGDTSGALAQWQAVRDLLPHHQVAYFHTGRLLARLKQWEEARKALEITLQLRPDLLEAYLELGQVYANQGNSEDALKMYAQAQQMRPDDPRIHLRRASLYISQNQHELARENLKEAIRLRPAFWEAHYLMGIELAMQEKYAEAQVEFEATLRYKPAHVSANFNLAVAIAKQHRYEEAIAKFQETLRLDPTHQQARQYLDALQTMRK